MLKDRYPVAELCREMNVNRSGYYKWAARKGTKNQYKEVYNEDYAQQIVKTNYYKNPV